MSEAPGYAASLLATPLGKARGYTRMINLPVPLAGQPVKYTVPPDRYQRLVMLYTGFVSSAVVANRFPRLEFRDQDGALFGAFTSIYAIPATDTVDFTWAHGWPSPTSATSADMAFGLPDLVMENGWSINITALALDAGDQFTTPKAVIETFPTGPFGPAQGVVPLDEPPWANLG